MTDDRTFDHRPDPELGAALRAALTPGDQARFVARVTARYDAVLEAATVPTWEVLASWSRRGVAAAAAAAVIVGLLLGRAAQAPGAAETETIDAAMAPTVGPGLAALVTASAPPDASIVFTSLVEPQ